MQTISKLFAEIGFKVNTSGLKEFQSQVKALNAGLKAQIQDSRAQVAASRAVEAAHKADTAEIKKGIATRNLEKAATQAQTAELRNLDLQQRMETRAQRAADAQRQRSVSSLRSFVVGISAAAYAVTKLTQQTRAHALAYRDYAFQTGMPLENLQQFEAAASRVAPGLSGGQIASELTNLQQNLTNIEFGQGDIFPYQLLGISAATKDATKIVDGLRNAIKGLSNARAVNLIERMGLSRDWLYILRMNREEFEKIQAVMLSPEQVKATTRMSLALNQLKFSLSNFRDQIVALNSKDLTDLFKNVSDIADAFSKWFKESSNAKAFFDALTIGLTAFLLRARPLIALLTTLLALFEDFWVSRQGGNSLFGWFQNNQNADTKVTELPKTEENSAWNRLKKAGRSFLSNISAFEMGEKGATREKAELSRSIAEGIIQTLIPRGEIGALGSTINNNINMNGYTPIEGGEFIGALNQNQSKISDNNLVASQMTTIGSAG